MKIQKRIEIGMNNPVNTNNRIAIIDAITGCP
jgi:hypothetical protein